MDKGMDEDDIDEDEVDNMATDIIKVILFCIILICTTSWPFAWENWCRYFRNQGKDVSTNSDGHAHEESNAMFLPTPLSQPTVRLFTTYLKGTLADANGCLENSMPGWTGQGDATSTPSELKNPQRYCIFVEKLAQKIGTLCPKILHLIRQGDEVKGRHELAINMVKKFLNECSGNQVKRSVLFHDTFVLHCLMARTNNKFAYCCHEQVVFDLEEMFPGTFGQHEKMFPGFGSKKGFQAFKDWEPSQENKVLANALREYIHKHVTDDELAIMGVYKDSEGNIRVLLNDRILELGDRDYFSCGLYQIVAWTMSNRAANVAQPQQAHCHQSKTEVASNLFSGGIIYSKDILKIAVDALDAGERIFSKEQCPTQYHLSNEEEIKELLDENPSRAVPQ
jgi:hypothetical protein